MKEHYQGLGHVAIYTADMDQSIAFYEKIGGGLKNQASIQTPDGEKKLALVDFGGVTLELIQAPTPMPLTEGNVPHFAVYVDDVDAAAADIKAAGVDTFLTPQKKVLPNLFGGRPRRRADRAAAHAVHQKMAAGKVPAAMFQFAQWKSFRPSQMKMQAPTMPTSRLAIRPWAEKPTSPKTILPTKEPMTPTTIFRRRPPSRFISLPAIQPTRAPMIREPIICRSSLYRQSLIYSRTR